MSAQSVRAATLVEPGEYELRKYRLPEPAQGCVLVKMEMSGICGTDKHTYQGFVTQYGDRRLEFPIIQGRENVGTIAAVGGDGCYSDYEGVPLRVGDRVVVGAHVSCGQCYYCRHDFAYYCCEKTTDYGNNLDAKHPPHLFGGWSQMTQALQQKCNAFAPTRRALGQFIAACHDLDAVVRNILLPNPTPHDETHRLLLQVPGASTAST